MDGSISRSIIFFYHGNGVEVKIGSNEFLTRDAQVRIRSQVFILMHYLTDLKLFRLANVQCNLPLNGLTQGPGSKGIRRLTFG